MDGRRDGDFPVRDERSTEGVVFGRSRVLIARAVTMHSPLLSEVDVFREEDRRALCLSSGAREED